MANLQNNIDVIQKNIDVVKDRGKRASSRSYYVNVDFLGIAIKNSGMSNSAISRINGRCERWIYGILNTGIASARSIAQLAAVLDCPVDKICKREEACQQIELTSLDTDQKYALADSLAMNLNEQRKTNDLLIELITQLKEIHKLLI